MSQEGQTPGNLGTPPVVNVENSQRDALGQLPQTSGQRNNPDSAPPTVPTTPDEWWDKILERRVAQGTRPYRCATCSKEGKGKKKRVRRQSARKDDQDDQAEGHEPAAPK